MKSLNKLLNKNFTIILFLLILLSFLYACEGSRTDDWGTNKKSPETSMSEADSEYMEYKTDSADVDIPMSERSEGSTEDAEDASEGKDDDSDTDDPETSGNQPQAGLLTAGSFYDSLNLDIFKNYWDGTKLKELEHQSLVQANWEDLIITHEEKQLEKLEISFVLDVTGSMSDELEYLQTELEYITRKIKEKYPNVEQKYSLVSYRDIGDEFTTKKVDFNTDLDAFASTLNAERARGGGDYPEAMDKALADAQTLSWGGEDTAKIMFLVADAPPHSNDRMVGVDEIFKLRDSGVNIYSIAASGVGDEAEEFMRLASILTGGAYIFLTDDSGVGGSHAEPKFPCYHVQLLKDTMIASIETVLTGVRTDPTAEQIIRTVGTPQDGVCVSEQVDQDQDQDQDQD